MIAKCDPNYSDTSDYQVVVDLQALMNDAKMSADALLYKLNPTLIQNLCSKEKIVVFDQIVMQQADSVQIFGNGDYVATRGLLAYGGQVALEFKDISTLKLQSQFGFVAIRQCAVDRQPMPFEQQLITLFSKLLNQPPDLITILSFKHKYDLQKLDIGCQLYAFYVDNTLRMTPDTIQILQFKNKVHFSSDFQIQQIQISPFNFLGQPIELAVLGTELQFFVIKWYQSDKPLHPLSSKWGVCEKEQSLNYTPMLGSFIRCTVEVPDTRGDKLYQIVIVVNLNGEEDSEDLPLPEAELVPAPAVLPLRPQSIPSAPREPSASKGPDAGYLQFSVRPELTPTNCKLYRACRGKYFSYVQDLALVPQEDEYRLEYKPSGFDYGFELLLQVELENQTVNIYSGTQRSYLRMGTAFLTRLRQTFARLPIRMKCQYQQHPADLLVDADRFELSQTGQTTILLSRQLACYAAGPQAVRVTNGQQRVVLEFEDQADAYALFHFINALNGLEFYDLQLREPQTELGDQFVAQLRDLRFQPGGRVELLQAPRHALYLNLFRGVRQTLLATNAPYELTCFDLGQVVSARFDDGYEVPLQLVQPAQSSQLLYQMEQLS